VHVHELGEVEPGPLHHLDLPDVDVVEGVDALAGLHDVAGDGVGDQLVNNSLQVIGGNLLGDDLQHLATNVTDLNIIFDGCKVVPKIKCVILSTYICALVSLCFSSIIKLASNKCITDKIKSYTYLFE